MLQEEAFAGYTWLQVGLAALALIVLLKLLSKVFAKKEENPANVDASCPYCDWSGTVSKFHKVCPRCAKRII